MPRGYDDFHEAKYQRFLQFIRVTPDDLFMPNSPSYTLELYPSDEFYDTYRTSNPVAASIGAVVGMIFTSVLFLLYDFLVRRDINYKRELLDAKRQFVRFVSHEVRTPLNAVYMGLTLMQDDIAKALGHKSTDELRSAPEESFDTTGIRPLDVFDWFQLSTDILLNTQSAVEVLSDVLNYDKIESGKIQLELSGINPWDLVERTLQEF